MEVLFFSKLVLVDSCPNEKRSGVEAEHRKRWEILYFRRGNNTPNIKSCSERAHLDVYAHVEHARFAEQARGNRVVRVEHVEERVGVLQAARYEAS